MGGRVYLSPVYDRGLVSLLLKDPTSPKVDPLLDAALDMIRAANGGPLGTVVIDGLPVNARYLPAILSELGARGKIVTTYDCNAFRGSITVIDRAKPCKARPQYVRDPDMETLHFKRLASDKRFCRAVDKSGEKFR